MMKETAGSDATAEDPFDAPDEPSADSGGGAWGADGSQRACLAAANADAESPESESHAARDLKEPEDDRDHVPFTCPPGLRMVRPVRARD